MVAVRRGGEIALAADGMVSWGTTALVTQLPKLRRSHGCLFGFSGPVGDCLALWRVIDECAPDWDEAAFRARSAKVDEAVALVAPMDGRIAVLTPKDGSVTPSDHDVIGVGTGGDFAWGAAMSLLEQTDWDAARIAVEALRVAERLDAWTSRHVTVKVVGSAEG